MLDTIAANGNDGSIGPAGDGAPTQPVTINAVTPAA